MAINCFSMVTLGPLFEAADGSERLDWAKPSTVRLRETANAKTTINNLREKGPDHDRGCVDATPAEQTAMLGKDFRYPFGRQKFGKRQALAGEKCIGNYLKIAAAG
jgi:hypothetical protein